MLTLEQKLIRQQGIGASESAILFGLSEYSTPYQLWLDKTSPVQPDDNTNDDFWWGHALEPVIAARYEHETGKKLVEDTNTKYNPHNPYMIAHLDRIVEDEPKIVEIKTARYAPDKWGEPFTSEVPRSYQLQAQSQMACMPGYDSVDLVVFFWQTKSIKIYTIKRNEEIIKQIESAVTEFWLFHVQSKIAPDLFTIKDVKLAYPFDNSTFLEASPIELEIYEDLKSVRKEIKEKEVIEEKLKTELVVLTGANTGIKQGDGFVCTYKANKNGVRSFKLYGEDK